MKDVPQLARRIDSRERDKCTTASRCPFNRKDGWYTPRASEEPSLASELMGRQRIKKWVFGQNRLGRNGYAWGTRTMTMNEMSQIGVTYTCVSPFRVIHHSCRSSVRNNRWAYCSRRCYPAELFCSLVHYPARLLCLLILCMSPVFNRQHLQSMTAPSLRSTTGCFRRITCGFVHRGRSHFCTCVRTQAR